MEQLESNYRISIKALILDDQGRFLLSRQTNGVWNFLGGGIHFGETIEECLIREIREETGLKVVSMAQNLSYFLTFQKQSNASWHANVFYKVQLHSLAFTTSEECLELRFFNKKEATEIKCNENVIKFCNYFL